MIEEEIQKRVGAHYDRGDAVLMLSDLGVELRAASLWPPEGETKSLSEFVASVPNIKVVRDTIQKAFAVVVPSDKVGLAVAAIHHRANVRILRKLPRAAVVAFCLDNAPGIDVFLRREPPIKYLLGSKPDDPAFVPIEPEYRVPGLFIGELSSLEPHLAEELTAKIKAWGEAHRISIEDLFAHEQKTERQETTQSSVKRQAFPPLGSSALERLLAAQTPEVAAQLSLPIDIALALSRMP